MSSLKIPLFIPLLLLHFLASSALECGVVGVCNSNLLDLSHTSSLEGCVIFGKNVPEFNFVSWRSVSGVCEAYASCEDLDDSDTTTLTSSVDCQLCHVPGLCFGHVVEGIEVDGEEECERLCINEDKCAWVSYLEDQQYCLILDVCSNFISSHSNCHTSMKTCLDSTTIEQPSTTVQPSTTSPGSLDEKKLFYMDGYTGAVTIGKNNNSSAYLLN